MPITPDVKDWTWVLERSCPECGFDTRGVTPEMISGLLRENAARWAEVLQGSDLGHRPADDVWSPLEYACHVRDVNILYDERLHLILDHDDPTFPNWDQDAAAVSDRYSEQDPAVVSTELAAAAGRLAQSFESLSAAQWDRTGTRSDGASFTVETFARYMVHDPIHHLYDVGKSPSGPGE
ncbi:MAG: DinB family protein [Actinomycetota bacterium]|nr:DinB family protein [Actinomycetota bacterium]